jgi:FtsP/CotA-like multicopper oxidase with cupredoxin domain
MKGEMPEQRPRPLLTMYDMGMDMDMSGMDHSKMSHEDRQQMMEDMKSGWAKAGTPAGDKALDYKDLRYLGTQKDTRSPERTIEVRLGGNMERYIWTMNGKKYSEAGPINLKYGERVRLKFTNDTMMAHPMHLHGMFVQLENGQPAGKLPNKHTVIVPPGESYSVLLTADEAGEWAFHCHLLYHMMAGMMREVVVAKLDAADVPAGNISPEPENTDMDMPMNMEGGHSHAH